MEHEHNQSSRDRSRFQNPCKEGDSALETQKSAPRAKIVRPALPNYKELPKTGERAARSPSNQPRGKAAERVARWLGECRAFERDFAKSESR